MHLQYAFLFLACFLLFMIKLLYVDDTYTIAPHDHGESNNAQSWFVFSLAVCISMQDSYTVDGYHPFPT